MSVLQRRLRPLPRKSPSSTSRGRCRSCRGSPNSATHVVARSEAPVPSDSVLTIVPTHTFATCPPLDLLCIPGGTHGVNRADRSRHDRVRPSAGPLGEVRDLGLHRRRRARRRRIAAGATGDHPLGLRRAAAHGRRHAREGPRRQGRQRDRGRRGHVRDRLRPQRGGRARRRSGSPGDPDGAGVRPGPTIRRPVVRIARPNAQSRPRLPPAMVSRPH